MNSKKYFLSLLTTLVCTTALTDCKPTEEAISVKPTAQFASPAISSINVENEYVRYFLKSAAFKYAEQTLGGVQIDHIELAQNEHNESVKGLIISVKSVGEVKRDIMVAIALDEQSGDNKIVAMIREQNVVGKQVGGKIMYSGFVRWKMADGVALNEMTIERNAIGNFKTFSRSSARLASAWDVAGFVQVNSLMQLIKL